MHGANLDSYTSELWYAIYILCVWSAQSVVCNKISVSQLTRWLSNGYILNMHYVNNSLPTKNVTWSSGRNHMLAVFNFDFSTWTTCPFRMLHFDATPISVAHLVAEIWTFCKVRKQCKNKNLSLLLVITQNQYSQHEAHSPWSCHTC